MSSGPPRDGAGQLFSLPAEQRRVLIACGTGAGLAAVYNVPFAGALFAVILGPAMGLAFAGYAVVGAAALLTAAIEASATGIAMTVELTGAAPVTVPILLASVGATVVSRKLETRSIYSARLAPMRRAPAEPPAGGPAREAS
jgi:H+/Cl- antiporter ClcA